MYFFFKVQTLEQENAALKKRIQELERMKGVEPSQQVRRLCNDL